MKCDVSDAEWVGCNCNGDPYLIEDHYGNKFLRLLCVCHINADRKYNFIKITNDEYMTYSMMME